ncbi:hypothetical protein HF078_07025 [Bacillus sp. RO2]|uniref:hypothetical protein n=1 Tax=Bacillus sp. RO2 TaxID=2723913 RepID=UPI00145D1088|nr:hypothetical protein [Bacillus sp. RO2]NMH72818.1 hypothetical protein [Bacillus sp. RO2]
MKKDVTHRIEYYTRKVAQRAAVHPSKKQPRFYKYRGQCLLAYKELMHEEIRMYQEARSC